MSLRHSAGTGPLHQSHPTGNMHHVRKSVWYQQHPFRCHPTQTTFSMWHGGNTISPEDSCLKSKFCIFFHCFHPQTESWSKEWAFIKGLKAKETWSSQALDATANSCPLRTLCLRLPGVQRQAELSKGSHNYHHYLQGDTEEGESFFGFFEAYLFQWKCYQKG